MVISLLVNTGIFLYALSAIGDASTDVMYLFPITKGNHTCDRLQNKEIVTTPDGRQWCTCPPNHYLKRRSGAVENVHSCIVATNCSEIGKYEVSSFGKYTNSWCCSSPNMKARKTEFGYECYSLPDSTTTSNPVTSTTVYREIKEHRTTTQAEEIGIPETTTQTTRNETSETTTEWGVIRTENNTTQFNNSQSGKGLDDKSMGVAIGVPLGLMFVVAMITLAVVLGRKHDRFWCRQNSNNGTGDSKEESYPLGDFSGQEVKRQEHEDAESKSFV